MYTTPPASTHSSRISARSSTPTAPAGRVWRRTRTSPCCCSAIFRASILSGRLQYPTADSPSLRDFLHIALHEAGPDHSTVSCTLRRIDLHTRQTVFTWVLQRLTDAGLLKGKRSAIHPTTLGTNAAQRRIVGRNTREDYETFLHRLPAASAVRCRRRQSWRAWTESGLRTRPTKSGCISATDAKIAKIEDGRTHFAEPRTTLEDAHDVR